jgi:hypothetical protein
MRVSCGRSLWNLKTDDSQTESLEPFQRARAWFPALNFHYSKLFEGSLSWRGPRIFRQSGNPVCPNMLDHQDAHVPAATAVSCFAKQALFRNTRYARP